ncbi:MAG: hypothetical protein NVS3B2_15920 [Ramlibacter sp.]
MGLLDFLWHLAGFIAPAAGVALLVSLVARFVPPGSTRQGSWTAALMLDFAAGTAALLAALWLTGRDGTMAGYGALVLASATSQWLLGRSGT